MLPETTFSRSSECRCQIHWSQWFVPLHLQSHVHTCAACHTLLRDLDYQAPTRHTGVWAFLFFWSAENRIEWPLLSCRPETLIGDSRAHEVMSCIKAATAPKRSKKDQTQVPGAESCAPCMQHAHTMQPFAGTPQHLCTMGTRRVPTEYTPR